MRAGNSNFGKIHARRTSVHMKGLRTENGASGGFQTVAGRELEALSLNGCERSPRGVSLMVKSLGSMINAFY